MLYSCRCRLNWTEIKCKIREKEFANLPVVLRGPYGIGDLVANVSCAFGVVNPWWLHWHLPQCRWNKLDKRAVIKQLDNTTKCDPRAHYLVICFMDVFIFVTTVASNEEFLVFNAKQTTYIPDGFIGRTVTYLNMSVRRAASGTTHDMVIPQTLKICLDKWYRYTKNR